MPNKTCSWGSCKNTSRKKGLEGITFRKFPQPGTQKERCLEWIRRCGRPQEQLNLNRVGHYHYVCSEHFEEGQEDPVFACPYTKTPKSRPRKRKTRDESSTSSQHVEKEHQTTAPPCANTSYQTEMKRLNQELTQTLLMLNWLQGKVQWMQALAIQMDLDLLNDLIPDHEKGRKDMDKVLDLVQCLLDELEVISNDKPSSQPNPSENDPYTAFTDTPLALKDDRIKQQIKIEPLDSDIDEQLTVTPSSVVEKNSSLRQMQDIPTLAHSGVKAIKPAKERRKNVRRPPGSRPEKNKMCELCGKLFLTPFKLQLHVKRAHKDEKQYQCELCSYRCVTQNMLNSHMVKHSNIRPFPCSQCSKAFKTKRMLQCHEQFVHSTERRFQCDICKIKFKRNFSLKLHCRQFHSGSKEGGGKSYCRDVRSTDVRSTDEQFHLGGAASEEEQLHSAVNRSGNVNFPLNSPLSQIQHQDPYVNTLISSRFVVPGNSFSSSALPYHHANSNESGSGPMNVNDVFTSHPSCPPSNAWIAGYSGQLF